MKCFSCSNNWKRLKIVEYISLLSKCPNCGSRIIVRNDLTLSILDLLKNLKAKIH